MSKAKFVSTVLLSIYEYPYPYQQRRDEAYLEKIATAKTEDEAFENWPCGCELKPHDDDCGCCHWDSICNG